MLINFTVTGCWLTGVPSLQLQGCYLIWGWIINMIYDHQDHLTCLIFNKNGWMPGLTLLVSRGRETEGPPFPSKGEKKIWQKIINWCESSTDGPLFFPKKKYSTNIPGIVLSADLIVGKEGDEKFGFNATGRILKKRHHTKTCLVYKRRKKGHFWLDSCNSHTPFWDREKVKQDKLLVVRPILANFLRMNHSSDQNWPTPLRGVSPCRRRPRRKKPQTFRCEPGLEVRQ